ncbi:sphingomyelin phosphodiesterase-like [Aethina tumida]|uniref:sphingomyelin phosphodiesterase-like n=1 Tax=Aethina tumida TaxID=116153 RepID=UPI0021496D9C|nr:sphingomyelin phosphodiesterase-like [Aethina tumida]
MLRLLLLLIVSSTVLCSQYDDYLKVREGITEYIQQKTKPAYLLEATKGFNLTHLFRKNTKVTAPNILVCGACELAIDLLINERKNGASKEQLIDTVSGLCTILNVEPDSVCRGTIELNADPLTYIFDNMQNLTSKRVCSLVLQKYECSKGDNFEWEIEIPLGNSIERPKPSESSGQFNIIQLSDFHYDPLYTVGKSSKCAEPLCCQSDSIDPENENDACGYWSDYNNADIPWHLIEETVERVNEHKFDYVYYTGDIISHRVWSTSVENNTRDIKKVFDHFREVFDVPVYPILGNHEPNPMNQWAENISDPNLSTSWLYELVANEWSTWLPLETQQTILKGGFYTVSPRPGFRIVALNSNVCYTVNWWLIWDDYDPYGQLNWLVNVLLEAEQNGESVHILSHIPSGSQSCVSVWSREFNKIINRFANTITGIFNGHTHTDEFYVYYNNSNPDQAINVAYNGASVVTYTDNNPSYKVIHVNNETFAINDICEWTFNLTEANLQPEERPNWYELYSFKTAYNLNSLEPSDLNDLLHRMATNETIIKQFNTYTYRNSDTSVAQDCDENCQKSVLCTVSVTEIGNTNKCKELQDLWDAAHK